MDKVPFYKFPTDKDRRAAWVAFVNRKKLPNLDTSYICGHHFITGKKSQDKIHPDWVPSINKYATLTSSPGSQLAMKRRSADSVNRSLRLQKLRKIRADDSMYLRPVSYKIKAFFYT